MSFSWPVMPPLAVHCESPNSKPIARVVRSGRRAAVSTDIARDRILAEVSANSGLLVSELMEITDLPVYRLGVELRILSDSGRIKRVGRSPARYFAIENKP